MRPLFQTISSKTEKLISNLYWSRQFKSFGQGSRFGKPLWVDGLDSVVVGENVTIWKMARVEALFSSSGETVIEIGNGTSIGPFFHVGAAEKIEIGKHCLIASYVYISDHDHLWGDFEEANHKRMKLEKAPVRIGDNVWLGERVTILKGVTIGDGSIVGAGAVVTQSIPEKSIAVGIPAKVIKSIDS